MWHDVLKFSKPSLDMKVILCSRDRIAKDVVIGEGIVGLADIYNNGHHNKKVRV